MDIPGCTIFIPAYQAEHTLAEVIERIPEPLWPSLPAVLIINDGSTDGTDRVGKELSEKYPAVQVHNQPENRGYGAAVRRQVRWASSTSATRVPRPLKTRVTCRVTKPNTSWLPVTSAPIGITKAA